MVEQGDTSYHKVYSTQWMYDDRGDGLLEHEKDS
jgi:hypothetical protein